MAKPEQLLTPREAAEYLRLNPRTVVRLAREGKMPAVKAGNRWRFRASAIAGWMKAAETVPSGAQKSDLSSTPLVTANDMPSDPPRSVFSSTPRVSPEHTMPEGARSVFSAASHVSVVPLLRPDLIICGLRAEDRGTALAEVAGALADGGYLGRPEEFLALLLEREGLMSTRLVEGVAVPHPRRAAPGMFGESLVAVAISPRGVDFGGADGKRVKVLFVICASDDRAHLRILARLSRLLRETGLYRTLQSAANPVEAIEAVRTAEKALPDETDAAAG